MHIYHNIPLTGAENRPFLLDAYQPAGATKAVVLFVHGFKGFKDWGHWDRIARFFANADIAFVKFNLSHNGTTPDSPGTFDDLEAFGQNNYSKERFDIQQALHWVQERFANLPIFLIGHSRGGAICIVEAATRTDLAGLITWASVSSLAYAWQAPGFMEEWKKEGVYHVLNGRTGQQMPLYYQLYEDYQANLPDYDVEKVITQLTCPLFIVHGSQDPAVPTQSAQDLHQWAGSNSQLHIIEGADHVFGGRHPYLPPTLPDHSEELVGQTLQFITATLG
jgi:pimeloyl-ACP methyl ester carboxylesterase